MKRSAILKAVPHQDLEKSLGNQVQQGWVITQAVPTYTNMIAQATGGITTVGVTHWTLFLETEIDPPPPL